MKLSKEVIKEIRAKGFSLYQVESDFQVGLSINGSVVFVGDEEQIWKWLESDKPAGLDSTKVDDSIRWNSENPGKQFSRTVDLPNWDHPLHVGSLVKTENGNRYAIVDIKNDWAVIVPVGSLESPPACAYTTKIDNLTPFGI